MWGAGLRAAAQHSQSLLSVFTHIPGLKVAAPSNAYDAKGLMIASIRDDDPVIFAEHKMLYDTTGDVPEESYAIPFGEANVAARGGRRHDRRHRPDGAHRARRRPASSPAPGCRPR